MFKVLQNLVVGTLFFGALAIVAHFTIFSESGPFASRGKQMVLYFSNADGIKVGSRVTVLGVPSGSVVDVALVPVDADNRRVPSDSPRRVSHKVAVTIELKQDVIFYENYRVAIKGESLLSDKMVAIDPGFAIDGRTGQRYARVDIFSVSARELEENKTTALEEELRHRETAVQRGEKPFVDLQGEAASDPVAGISELIEENRENVRLTLDNIASITGKINRGRGTIGRLVNDDDLHRNANTLLTDAQIVVKELRESLEDTREQAPVTSFLRAALTAF